MTREDIIREAKLLQFSKNPRVLAVFISKIADEKIECSPEPQGLDEAAEDVYKEHLRESEDIEFLDKNLSIGMFKSGAKWMAGQGYIREGVARPDDCEIWVNMIDTDIKDGDKVIVQIRKK